MDNMIYILFICIALPLLLSMGLLEQRARQMIGFLIIGIFMCMFAAEVNGLIRQVSRESLFLITTTYTPVSEEIIKAMPVLFYAFVFSDNRDTLISISMAIGIGFAILENAYILTANLENVNILWAVTRVFGASLMHGICTSTVGIGISFVRKRKKLFYTGSFALLSAAIIYHGIYNALVQSAFPQIGYLMPIVTYIPIFLVLFRTRARKWRKDAELSKNAE